MTGARDEGRASRGESRIAQAARRALGEAEPGGEPARRRTDRFAIPEAERDAQIERVSIDVRIEDRVEAVVLVLREGELAWSCTDGTAGRESAGPPGSAFVRSALRWVTGGALGGAIGATGAGALGGATAGAGAIAPAAPAWPASGPAPIEPPARDTRRSSVPGGIAAPTEREPAALLPAALASALDDAITEIVRAGVAGRDSPSVRDAIERVSRAVTPTPAPVARWLGRLERAMRRGDARMLARLLDGAAIGADDLRASSMGARGRAWLARADRAEQIVDRPMIEVARESLDGTQRASIERRYLVDVASGELLCEERARADAAPSLGPCPRALAVGLAEAIPGPAPRRVRLLQYTVTLEVAEADLERVASNAFRRSALVIERYREQITEWPALAEPVAAIAVAGIEDGFLVDAVGEPIPIARDEDPGAAAALDAATRAGDVEWLVGRIVDDDGAVRVVPCSFARRGKLVRLR